MYTNSTLTREDGAVFRCTLLSHWSTISRDYALELERRGVVPTTKTPESDLVKWVGDDMYIGAKSGHKYKLDAPSK